MYEGLAELKKELEKHLETQELLLLCGELSKSEILTAKALIKWMLRLCDKHKVTTSRDVSVLNGELSADTALKEALGAVNRTRQSYPDSQSSLALRAVESELRVKFGDKGHAKNKIIEETHAPIQP